jgi:hypothetical protein
MPDLPTTFMEHELKTDAKVFDAVKLGEKTFEIRKADRPFEVGDLLILRKTVHTGQEMAEGMPLYYEGEPLRQRVSYILRGPVYGLAEGWVIMSIEPALA